MDFIAQLQELALASRMKRLSDRLMKDASQIYSEMNIDFKARWFPVLCFLGQEPKMTITGLAQSLGMSHPAVNQIATQMLSHGLLRQSKDIKDLRKRLLTLSPKGRKIFRQLEPVWNKIKAVNREMLAETGVDLINDLAQIEASLDKHSMENRLRDRLGLPRVDRLAIVDYRPAYKKHFKSLNVQWQEKYFSIEDPDAKLLNDPNRNVIKKGGAILFALLENKVVGTCALLRHGTNVFELAKMAVDEKFQGRGIGEALVLAIIDRAQKMGATHLYLQTSPKLTAAGKLYRRLGFRGVRKHPLNYNKYERYTITMRLDLKKYNHTDTE